MNLESELKSIQDLLSASSKVIPVGANSKPSLGCLPADATPVATHQLTGILAYDPSEFLITAAAGTPLATLQAALDEKQQYLPFDPLLADRCATLGGCIASGISGPRRLLYGSIRDFVMEVAFLDGSGELVRGGGKVVKNAAGFDFPKMLVGSYGRMGIMTELTLKVLPKPESRFVVRTQADDVGSSIVQSKTLLGQPLPINALDILPDGGLQVEFASLEDSRDLIIQRCAQLLECDISSVDGDANFGADLDHDRFHMRVGCRPDHVEELVSAAANTMGLQIQAISAGGQELWFAADEITQFDCLQSQLCKHHYCGLVMGGSLHELTFVGDTSWMQLSARLQQALDPQGKFVSFGDESTSQARASTTPNALAQNEYR